jgi:hypothetical protein
MCYSTTLPHAMTVATVYTASLTLHIICPCLTTPHLSLFHISGLRWVVAQGDIYLLVRLTHISSYPILSFPWCTALHSFPALLFHQLSCTIRLSLSSLLISFLLFTTMLFMVPTSSSLSHKIFHYLSYYTSSVTSGVHLSQYASSSLL